MNRFAAGIASPVGAEVLQLTFRVGRCGERLRELITRRAPEEVIQLELANLARTQADLGEKLFGLSATDLQQESR